MSAGEAHLSHPTQGLLDALTIRQGKGGFGGLSVAIVGDIAPLARRALRAPRARDARRARHPHRRAAGDDAGGRRSSPGARRFESLDDGIAGADVVMMLRIQQERCRRRRP